MALKVKLTAADLEPALLVFRHSILQKSLMKQVGGCVCSTHVPGIRLRLERCNAVWHLQKLYMPALSMVFLGKPNPKAVVQSYGNRKTAPTTLFTAPCEREALLLADNFDNICQASLNTFEIARRVNRNIYSLYEMNAASRVLMEILEVFEEVPEDPADYVDENIPASYSINMLSLLTHGFGHNAIKTAIIHGTPPSYVPCSQSPTPRFT
ncbi:hypothetical protein Aduo_000702 [Ancylostoma duodenale]